MSAPVTAVSRFHGNLLLTQAPHRPSWRPRGEANGYCEARVAVRAGNHCTLTLTETAPKRETCITLDPRAARALARYILDELGPE